MHLCVLPSDGILDQNKNANLCQLLLPYSDFFEKDHIGNTALHYACESGFTECINFLVKKGLSLNEKK